MASVKKRKGSKFWQAQFYAPDPATGELKQIRRATSETNKSRALLIAAKLERAAHGAVEPGSDTAQQSKAVFAAASAEIELGKFTSLSARKHLARLLELATILGQSEPISTAKHLARLLELATGEVLATWTLESWCGEWLRRKSRDSSKATMARYTGHTEAFLSWLGTERRNKPLESVTPQHVREWRESLQDGGRTGKTVLSYVKDLGAIYRAAMREGIISFNPCGTAVADIDTSDSQGRKPFTPDEVARLVNAAPSEEWRGLILLAAFTGLRLGDAARLSWEAVDLETKRITLIPSKTKRKKREVCIPLHPDLLAYLLAAPVADDSPAAPVFPALAKMKVNGQAGLSATFTAIMEAAGVDRGKPSRVLEGQQAGRVTFERGFHSLRHTFTTWLRNAGVSEEDRMSLTGHSTRESHQIYSHADEQAGKAAIDKLQSLKK